MMETGRLIIAPFDMKYLKDYFDGFDGEITKYQWPDPFAGIDDAREMLRGFLNETQWGETLFYAILSGDGRFIGSVELHGLDGDCPELGIWIIASEQRKGYAYEALRTVLDFVCAEYGKSEFFYEADIRNEASSRLLRKLEGGYEVVDMEPEPLTTDSGKELILQGHIIKAGEERAAGRD